MHPVLLTIGNIHLFALSVAVTLAWLVYSFLFWRHLRGNGIAEDKIFDLTFYATLSAFVLSRGLYVALHWELFADSLLKIAAIWIAPGFSLYGAIIGALISFTAMSRQSKVRLGLVLDSIAVSFPAAMIIGLAGVFLDGSVPGKIAKIPWALPVVGLSGGRHPVQLYEIATLLVLIIIIARIQKRALTAKRPHGVVGVWFFILFSIPMFVLEFFKDTRVYWISISANQWILIAIFAEALGAFYVRGGGREAIRPVGYKIKTAISGFTGGIHAKFSKRSAQ